MQQTKGYLPLTSGSSEPIRPRRRVGRGLLAGMLVCLSSVSAEAGGDGFTPRKKLEALARRLRTKAVPVETPCVRPGADAEACQAWALDRTLKKLNDGTADGETTTRIIQLGDSHIASDYITGMIRERLQKKFGNAGRGFVHADQPNLFGGRRLKRSDKAWKRTRVVDRHGPGKPFGFSGIAIESRKKGASAVYRVHANDETVRIYYHARRGGPKVKIFVDRRFLTSFSTHSETGESRVHTVEIPPSKKSKKKRTLKLVADGPYARILGLSFERNEPGVLFESIGLVGADAKVYLDLERASFRQHLTLHKPDLIILMVGGNDGLKIRKGWTTLDKVRRHHEDLLDFLRKTLPATDCLVWSPMDAAGRKGRRIVSKPLVKEIRDMQREVALAKACGFWDLYGSMGGAGAMGRWARLGVMNKDLIHPRKRAADLLGHIFFKSWIELDRVGG